MRPEERDVDHLSDMYRYSSRVVELASRMSFDAYSKDWVAQMAMERGLELIGEAARRMTAEFRLEHPEIPWKRIIAQRNVLTHEYGEIRQERVWHTATTHVPALLRQLQALIPEPPKFDDA